MTNPTYTNSVIIIKPAFQMVHFKDQRAASKFLTQRRVNGEICHIYKYDPARTFVQALIEMRKSEGTYEQR